MGCYSCAKEFGLLRREYGCAKCGFAFCASCLKNRAIVPGKGTKEQKVCSSCYKIIKNPESSERVYAPPEALQKRMERLENPGGTPVIVYKDNKKMTSLRKGLSVDDQKIVDRLEKLKRERREKENVPSDTQIAERLSKLKGETNPIAGTTSQTQGTSFYQPPDARKPLEQSNDLLAAVKNEVELDAKQISPEVDIAMRLAKLRGEDPEVTRQRLAKPKLPDPTQYLVDTQTQQDLENIDLDDVASLITKMGREVDNEAAKAVKDLSADKEIEEQLARIAALRKEKKDADGLNNKDETIDSEDDGSDSENESNDDRRAAELAKQLIREQELEDRLGLAPPVPQEIDSPEGLEELPWCVICNDDARLRCGGCCSDLYCLGCFKEFHQGEDPRDHPTKPFKQ